MTINLPAELRLRIYEFTFTYSQAVVVNESDSKHELTPETSAFLSRAQALIRTCKQIHEECGVLFYTRNDFALNLNLSLSNVIWTRHLAPKFEKAQVITLSSLDVTLPAPLRILDARVRSDAVALEQNRVVLYRLSNTLRHFTAHHPNVSITMCSPVPVSPLTPRSRFNISIDFQNFEHSIDRAVAELC